MSTRLGFRNVKQDTFARRGLSFAIKTSLTRRGRGTRFARGSRGNGGEVNEDEDDEEVLGGVFSFRSGLLCLFCLGSGVREVCLEEILFHL